MTQIVNNDLQHNDDWLFEISSKKSFFDIDFKELWRYRDLVFPALQRVNKLQNCSAMVYRPRSNNVKLFFEMG
jgi:hypothetical protein